MLRPYAAYEDRDYYLKRPDDGYYEQHGHKHYYG